MSNLKLLTPDETKQAHKDVPEIVLGTDLGINRPINCTIHQLSLPENEIASVLGKFTDRTNDSNESGIVTIFHEGESYVVSQHDVISLPSKRGWKKISKLLDLETAIILHIDGVLDGEIDMKKKARIKKWAIAVFTDKSGNIRTYAGLDRRENLSSLGKMLDILGGKLEYLNGLTGEMEKLLLQGEIVTSVS